jgi:hypothetical protein
VASGGRSPGQVKRMANEKSHDLRHAAAFGERREHQPNAVAPAGVRVEIDGPVGLSQVTRRKVLNPFATVRFRASARVEPQPQAMTLGLRQSTLPPQHEPVVELPGMVDAIDIGDERVEQRAPFEQPIPVGMAAGQARDFGTQDDADLAQADIRHERWKAFSPLGGSTRLPRIFLDQANPIRGPAPFAEPLLERALVIPAFAIV